MVCYCSVLFGVLALTPTSAKRFAGNVRGRNVPDFFLTKMVLAIKRLHIKNMIQLDSEVPNIIFTSHSVIFHTMKHCMVIQSYTETINSENTINQGNCYKCFSAKYIQLVVLALYCSFIKIIIHIIIHI